LQPELHLELAGLSPRGRAGRTGPELPVAGVNLKLDRDNPGPGPDRGAAPAEEPKGAGRRG
jgi:hypothetical protein